MQTRTVYGFADTSIYGTMTDYLSLWFIKFLIGRLQESRFVTGCKNENSLLQK